jgi:hypothetical protein
MLLEGVVRSHLLHEEVILHGELPYLVRSNSLDRKLHLGYALVLP